MADVRALDAAAITEYAIPGILLMEHAALGVVGVIETLCPSLAGLSVVIGCGQGNNGGDGWAVARLLHHRGVSVTVVPLGEPAPGSDAAINATIARRMGIPEQSIGESWGTPALVVDALFGTGLSRPPTGDAALFIARCNAAECPVVAVDVPSGLNADTGDVPGEAVRATVTATFVASKCGFRQPGADVWLGDVRVIPIGLPRALWREFT